MSNRSELSEILRRLADYIDRHPDEKLAPIFGQAARLVRKNQGERQSPQMTEREVGELASRLRVLPSREAGQTLLEAEIPNRRSLEALARFLQLPVQRDDTVERLRLKIVENTIGARLRSDAIQSNS